MSLVGFSPTSQIIDPKTGLLTRDGFLLIQFFVESVNGAGAVITTDGAQTLTNKTIDGGRNTLSGIRASSMAEPTGDGDGVVTAPDAGTTNYLAMWSNGDLVDGPANVDVITTSVGDDRYVSIDGSVDTTGPVNLASFTVAGLPLATDYPNSMLYVSNEAGGATLAFSDGTNWLRVQDRAIVS